MASTFLYVIHAGGIILYVLKEHIGLPRTSELFAAFNAWNDDVFCVLKKNTENLNSVCAILLLSPALTK
jgi:hypothetical protein